MQGQEPLAEKKLGFSSRTFSWGRLSLIGSVFLGGGLWLHDDYQGMQSILVRTLEILARCTYECVCPGLR